MSDEAAPVPCPLCDAGAVSDHARDRKRTYLACGRCSLIFVPPQFHLAPEQERQRYDLHRNSPENAGYRGFLQRMVDAMAPHLGPASRGLDFGSGPETVLALLFEAAGHCVATYDSHYAPDRSALEGQYDFITATEVAEHLRQPRQELDRLWGCLRPGGWFGIMTQPAVDREAFPRWHYKNDLTHICFFSPGTFTWLAGRWNADLFFPEPDIALLHKRPGAA